MNCYLSATDYTRSVTGQETATLLGNLFILSRPVVASATSLPVVPPTTVNLNQGDALTLFDGAISEVVYVSASTSAGASSIPVSATQYAHASGVSCASDGRLGSLAEAIVEASAELERICRQPLLQGTYTNESLDLLTTRAFIDNDAQLWVRPRQNPVQSVSAISIQASVGNSYSVDISQVVLPSMGKLIRVPTVKATGTGSTWQAFQTLDPRTEGNVILSYTAGFAYASLPMDVRRAAVLLTSDILADRANPNGAAESQMGKMREVAYLRGDTTGESALLKRARKLLRLYIQEAA